SASPAIDSASPIPADFGTANPWSPWATSVSVVPGGNSAGRPKGSRPPWTTSVGTPAPVNSSARDFSGFPGGCRGKLRARTAPAPCPTATTARAGVSSRYQVMRASPAGVATVSLSFALVLIRPSCPGRASEQRADLGGGELRQQLGPVVADVADLRGDGVGPH